MADFCSQCSISIFGEDLRDLADLTTTTTLALCEGCGVIVVDTEGKCVDDGCPVHSKRINEK